MAAVPRVFLVLVVILAGLMELSGGTRMRANPIRRVITMLQMMMKKSEDQASAEEQLFDKFMCQCKASQEGLMKSMKDGKEKVPQLESSVEELTARIGTAKQDITQFGKDSAEAQKSLREANTMRNSDAVDYKKESTEAKANIQSMLGAINALKKGLFLQTPAASLQSSFLQTPAASLLQGLLATGKPAKGYDRDALSAFLQEGDQTEDAPEIIGILEQMRADMVADLKAMDTSEVAAKANFEALESAKSKQIKGSNLKVQQLTARNAGANVELGNTKTDLKDTDERLTSDSESYAASKESCQKRDQEYGILKKQFADEKVALADTIKILADDQAMAVFKKSAVVDSAAAATFLQIGSSSRHRQQQALHMLQETAVQNQDQPALQLLAKRVASAARQGGGRSKKGFEKITVLIDNMIKLLGKEGNDDKIKKGMCDVDLARNADLKTRLETGVSSESTILANQKDNLAIVVKDMAAIISDLGELDKTVKEATEQRKQENAAFTQMLSETNQAVGILEVAKNRLTEFYGKAFLQQPARFLQRPPRSSEEAVSFLQESANEAALDHAISSSTDEYRFLGGDATATSTRHKKKPQGSKAVLMMVARIQEDLTKEFQEAKTEEKDAQEAYEGILASAKKKREESARAMTEKEGTKAGLQEEQKKTSDKITGLKEREKETVDVLADLHKDCDWLLKNFQERVKLRAAEVEALMRAKATLAGADYDK